MRNIFITIILFTSSLMAAAEPETLMSRYEKLHLASQLKTKKSWQKNAHTLLQDIKEQRYATMGCEYTRTPQGNSRQKISLDKIFFNIVFLEFYKGRDKSGEGELSGLDDYAKYYSLYKENLRITKRAVCKHLSEIPDTPVPVSDEMFAHKNQSSKDESVITLEKKLQALKSIVNQYYDVGKSIISPNNTFLQTRISLCATDKLLSTSKPKRVKKKKAKRHPAAPPKKEIATTKPVVTTPIDWEARRLAREEFDSRMQAAIERLKAEKEAEKEAEEKRLILVEAPEFVPPPLTSSLPVTTHNTLTQFDGTTIPQILTYFPGCPAIRSIDWDLLSPEEQNRLYLLYKQA